MTKYSVLMALYKKENPEYLRKSLDSLLRQTVLPDEIVIVRDGHLTEALESVLDEYDSKTDILNIVGYEENKGLGFALNYGLERCQNELVGRMDTDDISLPERFEKQLKKFEQNDNLSLLGTSIDEFYDSPDNIISRRVVPSSHDKIYEFAKRRSAFNHPTVMYKKSDVLKVGGYSELRRNQDVDLFGRMLFSGMIAENIEESLLLFRCNADLSKRRKSWENTRTYIGTIRKFWKMGYSSFGDYIFVMMAQVAVFLMPLKLQNFVYKKFLRK